MALLSFLDKRKKDPEGEMTFIDHLEELRGHLIRIVIALGIGSVIAFIFAHDITDKIILGPTKNNFISVKWLCALGNFIGFPDALCFKQIEVHLQNTTMTGQFMATFTLAFTIGFIIAFPYIFWELWRFVRPALSDKEAKGTRGVVFWVTLLFLLGVAFGYLILTPFMVNFYFTYSLSSVIENKPTFSDYLENLIYTTVGIGLLFQLPLLIMMLAKIGVITGAMLRKYRKHAFVVILIASAIITPSTDPFSLMIVTIPLYALFEASVVIASRVAKNRGQKKEQEWS